MVISIVFASAWCVLQIIVLGSFARTVRIRTVYAAMAVGLYLCAPLSAGLEVGWTRLFAPLLGMSVPALVATAAHTLDPFVEELVKLLPLAMLVMVPMFRRQWSFTDFVLIGAATGAGFGLAEDLYRHAGSAHRAQEISGGWSLVYSQGYAVVPSIGKTLFSWLPDGASASDDAARLNLHLLWSAVGGLAVGLAVLMRTRAARLTALGLIVCISLDHAAANMSNLGSSWLALLSWPLDALAHLRGLMPVAAIAAAWWLDRQRQGARDAAGPLLEAEQSAPSRSKATLAAAFSRLPLSLIAVDRFVRMRRSFRTEHRADPARAVLLSALVVNERDRVDRELAQLQTGRRSLLPSGWTSSNVRLLLRRPAVIIWLVIMTPPVLWFVLGGWPLTAGLQAFMMRPGVWAVLFPISVLAQAWVAWRAMAGLHEWSQARGASIGDDAAVVGLRVACGVGAVFLGAFSLLRMLGGVTPGSSLLASLNAQNAANRLTPGGGSMLAGSAGAFAPPPPSLDLPDTAGAAAGSSVGSSAGTSSANADGGRPSAPAGTKPAPPRAPAPPDDAAADLAAAEQRRRDAQNALESAEIKQATDRGNDPDAATARDDAVTAARAAEQQADADVTAAKERARDAQAQVDAQAQAARDAADQLAAAQRQAADPLGVAAEQAARAADLAADRANQEFMQVDEPDPTTHQIDPSGAERRAAANEAAKLARHQADAAQAAADAAKATRDTYADRSSHTPKKP